MAAHVPVNLAPPAAIVQAQGAIRGLGALLNIADPRAWASLGRPEAQDVAHLVFAIGGKLDEGLADLGFDPPPALAG
jgi:hypothetical protein